MAAAAVDCHVAVATLPSASRQDRGLGLAMVHGFHPSPFGMALVVATEGHVTAIGFREEDDDGTAALADVSRRWPQATFTADPAATEPLARRVFDPRRWRADDPLRLLLIGTDFELAVWRRLLAIPFGATTTYAAIAAELGRPTASRAVGSVVGRNPISFVVPCHRVLGTAGSLCGYHWGLDRKRRMLDWERSLSGKAATEHDAPQPLLL